MDMELHKLYNRARLDDRQVNELVGLVRGIIADDILNQKEAEYLQKWLAGHTEVGNNPVIVELLVRINQVLRDNKMDQEECDHLFETLKTFSGEKFELGEILKSSTLPLDHPPPAIQFRNKRFCFTGTFATGTRKDCENAIVELGGSVSSLTLETHYLIVGIYATDSWVHSSYGRKIEKAVEMKQKGTAIAIVGEKHWREALDKIRKTT